MSVSCREQWKQCEDAAQTQKRFARQTEISGMSGKGSGGMNTGAMDFGMPVMPGMGSGMSRNYTCQSGLVISTDKVRFNPT